jgi:hypothetical protein
MNLSHRRAAATVSHDSIRDLDSPVAARTREREIKRAGHCRLGITRIGRAVMSGIAHDGPPCISRRSACVIAAAATIKRASARRDIDQIINTRRGQPKAPCRGCDGRPCCPPY